VSMVAIMRTEPFFSAAIYASRGYFFKEDEHLRFPSLVKSISSIKWGNYFFLP